MAFGYVFDALKAHYKARGLTYADVAQSLDVSEATIKRIFSSRDCTLARLEELCALIQVDLAELARTAPKETKLLNRLDWKQEEQLVDSPLLFITAVCAMNSMRFEEIIATYRISEAQCTQALLTLEKIGFLELLPNNRIRLRISRTFAWIPDGPIMQLTKRHAGDYFDASFGGPGEMMRLMNVRVSSEARVALLARMEQLAREYAEQHNADSKLALRDRYPLSVCLAVRHWEPKFFQQFRRHPEEA